MIVVVGVVGTLGKLLARRLGARGVEIRCADPREDVRNAEIAEANVVINAGGPRVRPELGWGDYFREHVGVTSCVARSMRPGARLVHVSSTAVYGARGQTLGAGSVEAPTLFPSPAYACAKLAAETSARAIGAERGVEVVVVRPSMVYGPGVESALDTLRRLDARGVGLRLTPASVRQHLVHVDLLFAIIERLTHGGAPRMVVAADPFVLTNADLAPRGRAVPVNVGLAANAHRHALARLGVAPSALEALAVLALDNVFDTSSLDALGLDLGAFARSRTFDPYWEAP